MRRPVADYARTANVAPRMAFLRRSCKNMPGSTDENSMKAMMWRYRDGASRTQSHLFGITVTGNRPVHDSVGYPEGAAQSIPHQVGKFGDGRRSRRPCAIKRQIEAAEHGQSPALRGVMQIPFAH